MLYKKILLIFLTIFSLIIVLTAVYLFQLNKLLLLDNKNEKNIDSFGKKIECEKIIAPIKNDMDSKELERISGNNIFKVIESFNLGFYSPKLNSCLYVTFYFSDIGERRDEIFIYDALSKRILYKYKNDSVGGKNFNEYIEKIKELSNGEIII